MMKQFLKVLIFLIILIALAAVITIVIKPFFKVGVHQKKTFSINKSEFRSWEQVFKSPRKVKVEVLKTGEIKGTMAGMINLADSNARNLKEWEGGTPVLSILIQHDELGSFLIDTGFDRSFSKKPWTNFQGLLKRFALQGRFFQEEGQGIDDQLKKRNIELKGVFFTHFHEHNFGAPALPDNIPYIYGDGEKEMDVYPWVFSSFLKDKTNVQVLNFDLAQDMPIVGKSVDVFGDGSFWAIYTPGHTKGHISYLINGTGGAYLAFGDVSITQKGFEIGVGTGTYSGNVAENQESFMKLKEFQDTYPQIKPIFGHESEEFKLEYK